MGEARRAIRLIVADLDGTLLNSAHVVTPATERAVRLAQGNGVQFTVATGKTFPSTVGLIRQFGIDIPVICSNGTQVFAPDGTLVYEDPIPQDYAIEAVDLAQQRGFTPIIYTMTGLLSSVHDDNVRELVEHHEPAPDIVPDLIQALSNGYKAFKLVLMSQDLPRVEDFQRELTEIFEGRAQVVRSGLLSLVEIMPFGVTKGTALVHILDHLGLGAEDTMCLGDNCNDVDMIRRAGIGVAMGNAPPDVREHADFVTRTNDEDGVAHAIARFVLKAPVDGLEAPMPDVRSDT